MKNCEKDEMKINETAKKGNNNWEEAHHNQNEKEEAKLEQVSFFKCLISITSEDLKYSQEIRSERKCLSLRSKKFSVD